MSACHSHLLFASYRNWSQFDHENMAEAVSECDVQDCSAGNPHTGPDFISGKCVHLRGLSRIVGTLLNRSISSVRRIRRQCHSRLSTNQWRIQYHDFIVTELRGHGQLAGYAVSLTDQELLSTTCLDLQQTIGTDQQWSSVTIQHSAG